VEEKEAEMIVFSLWISWLNPRHFESNKKCFMPCLGARAQWRMLTVDEIKRQKQYPNAPVVLYVNTLASCKAECDVCCTVPTL
jgi:quinolinate synthase